MQKGQDIVIMKFGGTSLASPDLIRKAARRVHLARSTGFLPVVIVSAMAGETDRILGLLKQMVSHSPELSDFAVAAGEQVSCALMAAALQEFGVPSTPLLAHHIGLVTDRKYGNADILSINERVLTRELSLRNVPVIAGFQGMTSDGRISTLGRGGSDTTAVAVAAALNAAVCEIYTDVDGVYEADPRVNPVARRYASLSYDAMQVLADHSAKVLHAKSVRLAKQSGVVIHVRSSFSDKVGTYVTYESAGNKVLKMKSARSTITREKAYGCV